MRAAGSPPLQMPSPRQECQAERWRPSARVRSAHLGQLYRSKPLEVNPALAYQKDRAAPEAHHAGDTGYRDPPKEAPVPTASCSNTPTRSARVAHWSMHLEYANGVKSRTRAHGIQHPNP